MRYGPVYTSSVFRIAHRLFRFVIMLAAAWAALVYGLPAARRAIPGACARWNLRGGFCTEDMREKLARTDEWVQRVLRPLPRQPRVHGALAEVSGAFRQLEALLREQVGDERVDAALRGTDVALQKLENLVGESGDARSKLTDVPENSKELLARVRGAFERLRRAVGSSSKRAEEVSGALQETKDALDALSDVIPE